jgi:hypothetical protein
MEQLFRYFIQETDKKFDELKGDIADVKEQLKDLSKFKAEMIATARTTSFIVSAICGAITLTVTVVVFLNK